MSISIEKLKSKAPEFRVGSPVIVNGNKTYVKSVPDNKGSIDGYIVANDATIYAKTSLDPIPIEDSFFRRHSNIFQNNNGVYECQNKGHVISVDDQAFCLIDGVKYGQVKQHELVNILEEVYDIHLPVPDLSSSNDIKEQGA
jgi:hypothetical protein